MNRSKCYVRLGHYDKALKDAESSIGEDKKFHRGLNQKAEALYAAGDFEYALVHFHRAHRVRPDIEDYQLGIRKAEGAIARAIGLGDSSASRPATRSGTPPRRVPEDVHSPLATATSVFTPTRRRPSTGESKPASSKRLLGDLFDDQEFLKRLQAEVSIVRNDDVSRLINTGLQYIESRSEFWRQQQSPVRGPSRPQSRPRSCPRPSMPRGGKPLPPTGRPSTGKIGARGSKLTIRIDGQNVNPNATGPAPRRPNTTGATRPGPPRSAMKRPNSGSRPGSRGVRYKEPETKKTPRPTGQAAAQAKAKAVDRSAKKQYMHSSHYVAKVLANIEEALRTGAPDLALQFSKALMTRIPTLDVPDTPRIMADVHSVMGTVYMALDRPTPALIHHKKDLDLAIDNGIATGHVRALRHLGNAYIRLNDMEMAVAVTTKIVDNAALPTPSYIIGEALMQRGRAQYELKRYPEAVADAQAAWATLNEPSSREPGTDRVDTALFGFDGDMSSTRDELQLDALCLLGRGLMAVGRDDEALAKLELCLTLAKERGDRTAEAAALTNLSVIALSRGDVDEGKRLQATAVEISQGG